MGILDSKLLLCLFPSEAATTRSIWDVNKTKKQEGSRGVPHSSTISHRVHLVFPGPARWYGFVVPQDGQTQNCWPIALVHLGSSATRKMDVAKQGSNPTTQPWNLKVVGWHGSMELSAMLKLFCIFAVQNGSH